MDDYENEALPVGEAQVAEAMQTLQRYKAGKAALELGDDDWRLTYQSRFGRERWLQPYAEPTLWTLAEAGAKTLDVICPGFATDCLETLEEVALGFSASLAQRGATMRYIPCLNDTPAHARALAALATQPG